MWRLVSTATIRRLLPRLFAARLLVLAGLVAGALDVVSGQAITVPLAIDGGSESRSGDFSSPADCPDTLVLVALFLAVFALR